MPSVIRGRQGAVFARGYIRGGPEAARALARFHADVSEAIMAQAILAGAEVIADAWRSRVPIDDGDYRQSITAVASRGRKGATGLVFTDTVPGLEESQQPRNYAPRLEFGSARATVRTLKRGQTNFGSRGRNAQPSLRPAYDASQRQAIDALGDELRHLIERAT